MNKAGIKRASREALFAFEQQIEESIKDKLPAMKEEMFVHGRKTLKPEDIRAVLEKKEKPWEV